MIAGQLGDITFEVLLSPEELEREQTWAYAEHEIAGGKNKLEATGEMLAHVKMRIRLHSVTGRWYCDPAEESDRIIQMARDQVYGDLFLGNRYLGQYAIGRISERQNRLAADGTIMSIELSLDLIEYN